MITDRGTGLVQNLRVVITGFLDFATWEGDILLETNYLVSGAHGGLH